MRQKVKVLMVLYDGGQHAKDVSAISSCPHSCPGFSEFRLCAANVREARRTTGRAKERGKRAFVSGIVLRDEPVPWSLEELH